MEIPLQNLIMFQMWPRAKINRNDAESVIFSKYYNFINKNEIIHHMTNNFDEEEPKSKNVSTIFRNKGNTCFKRLDYKAALEMYNISISRAPRDSTEFGLAIANRSAVLFDMKNYKDCLVDIDTVLRSEYPKNLMYKVFLRQSKCFVELNQMEKATASLKKTQESFNKEKKGIGSVQIALMDENIKNVASEINTKKENPTTSEDINNNLYVIPKVRDEENPKFLYASTAVNFRYTTDIERCVIAASDIKKGDVLFVEEPYAFCALNRREYKRFSICSFCFETSLTCVPCGTCTTHFYCSTKCQIDSWELIHKWECFNERHKIITDMRQELALSMLLKASHDGFKTDIEDKSVYGNKDNNHPYMNKLLTHKDKIPDDVLDYDTKSAIWIVLYLKKFTDYFDWLYVHPNRPAGSKEDLFNIVGGYIIKYLLQIGCNMDVIQEGYIKYDPRINNDTSMGLVGVGLGMYLSTALLNHSCLNNASFFYCGKVKVIKALKDLKQGTEITVNYLPGLIQGEDTKERQSHLEKYVFKCTCLMCTNPNYDDIYSPYLCTRCRGKAFPFRGKQSFKCSHCNLVFNRTKALIRNEQKIAQLLVLFPMIRNFNEKNTLHSLLKKTYHKDNSLYILYYQLCRKQYEKNGEIHKCFEPIKSMVETTANIFGNTSKQYVINLLQSTFVLVFYSNILKKQNSGSYEKFAVGTQENLQKAVECLQYYMTPRDIDEFVNKINDCIRSGKIMPIEDSDDEDDSDEESSLERFLEFCSLFG